MAERNLFEYAAKEKLRFPYSKGNISTEDLFDLNVEELDKIYRNLRKQTKDREEESLLASKTKEDTKIEVMTEIVKYVVSYKQDLTDRAKARREKRERDKRILEILAEKEDNDLKSKSPEELRAMLAEGEDEAE